MFATRRATTHRFLGVLTLALLVGLGGSPALARAQEPVEISYFTFSAAPDHLEDLDAMVAAFETANPGVRVEVETAPFDQYFTELQTRIAGGDAPDVFELNYENFVSYASKGVLLDLTPLATADPSLPARFYPRAYEAFSRDGKQYGLPAVFPMSSCSTTRTTSIPPGFRTRPATGGGRTSRRRPSC